MIRFVVVALALACACKKSEEPVAARPSPPGALTANCVAFKTHVEKFVQCNKLTADVKTQMTEAAASITGPNEDTGCQIASAQLEQTAKTLGCAF